RLLDELDIHNVRIRHADGMKGWKAQAPFDGILIAAAPLQIPQSLLAQLGKGGRLVAPVGPEGRQELVRITKHADRLERESLGRVAFLPLLAGVVRL
ncbi:MAG: protein-L-isoaspartate O-methyltransferase, partial [Steroidobacteraceae bacterium]|nr:protein-L-isoaspartate O-methyltransferase [Steroidobacteraceae bacterium]